MKLCRKCGETKPLTEFNKHSSNRDGLQYQCKSCCKEYRESNSEKAKAVLDEWKSLNPGKMKEYQATYYAKNKEKCMAANALWRSKNPESVRIRQQNRRAIKCANGCKLSRGLSKRLFNMQKGKCACGCKQPLGDDFHLDHIMPLALGGSHTDDNIQLLRAKCNLQKSAKHPIDFMQSRGFLL